MLNWAEHEKSFITSGPGHQKSIATVVTAQSVCFQNKTKLI